MVDLLTDLLVYFGKEVTSKPGGFFWFCVVCVLSIFSEIQPQEFVPMLGAHKLSMTDRALGPIGISSTFRWPFLDRWYARVPESWILKRQHESGKKKEEKRNGTKKKGKTNNGNLKNALFLKMNVEKGHAQTILAG